MLKVVGLGIIFPPFSREEADLRSDARGHQYGHAFLYFRERDPKENIPDVFHGTFGYRAYDFDLGWVKQTPEFIEQGFREYFENAQNAVHGVVYEERDHDEWKEWENSFCFEWVEQLEYRWTELLAACRQDAEISIQQFKRDLKSTRYVYSLCPDIERHDNCISWALKKLSKHKFTNIPFPIEPLRESAKLLTVLAMLEKNHTWPCEFMCDARDIPGVKQAPIFKEPGAPDFQV